MSNALRGKSVIWVDENRAPMGNQHARPGVSRVEDIENRAVKMEIKMPENLLAPAFALAFRDIDPKSDEDAWGDLRQYWPE
jgi:hypothetical protein